MLFQKLNIALQYFQKSKRKEEILMANKIRTSKKIARVASRQLRSKATSSKTKSVAASALRNRSK